MPKIVFAVAVLLLTVLPARGAIAPQTAAVGSVPTGISYQGQLQNNGFPVTGTQTMDFRVYDAVSGGTLVWDSGAQLVSVSAGVFSTILALPLSALTGGGARYLEVTVAGTTLSPREALNAVPYAMVAKSVEGVVDVSTGGLTLGPGSTTALFISSQTSQVGIGTNAPTARLTVNGDIRITNGSGGQLIFADGSSMASANVGSASVLSNATDAIITGDSDANGSGVVSLKTGSSERLRVANNGNLGVGTSNPATLLHMSSGTLTIDGNVAVSINATGSIAAGGGFSGDGSALTSLDAGRISQGTLDDARLPSTLSAKTFSGVITANAGIVLASDQALGLSGAAGNITTASSVTASAFFGDGSHLTGVTASQVRAGGLTNGPVASSVLPSTVAYTSVGNAFTAGQTLSNVGLTLTGANGVVTAGSSVTASAFFGDGAHLTGVTASQVRAGGLTNGPVASSILPSTVAYTSVSNSFTAGQTYSNVGLTLTGTNGVITGVSSVTASAFFGDGSHLTGVGGVPSGAVMFFNLSSCPSGWTELTAAQGRYVVGLPSGGTLAATAGTALSDQENRPTGNHYHQITLGNGSLHIGYQGVNPAYLMASDARPPSTGGVSDNNTIIPDPTANANTLSVSNQSNASGSPMVAGTNAPYIQLLVCQKD